MTYNNGIVSSQRVVATADASFEKTFTMYNNKTSNNNQSNAKRQSHLFIQSHAPKRA